MANHSACDAIANSDSVTSAVRIAFDAAMDRKAVIQIAADAADSLRPEVTVLQIMRPFPDPLEAIERWTGAPYHHSGDRKLLTRVKAGAIGFFVTVVAILLAKFFFAGNSSPKYGAVGWHIVGEVVVALCITTILVALWLNWSVQRQAARLDENSALNLVLRLIAAWEPRNANKLPDVHARLKRKLCELLDASSKPVSVELLPRPIAPPARVWPDYATFRAEHASVHDAIATCTRPDWLVHLGVEALPNHKTVLQLASDAASMLRASNRARMLTLFIPYPSRLEVIDAFSGNKKLLRDNASMRATMLALVPAAIFTYVGDDYMWGARFGAFRYQAATIIMFASLFVIALLIKNMLAMVVRTQAARLDDDNALRSVIEEIEKGMRHAPHRVPGAADGFKRHLRAIIDRSNKGLDGDARSQLRPEDP